MPRERLTGVLNERFLSDGMRVCVCDDTPQELPSAGPGLTMARSLGDLDADSVGVIPTPEVTFRVFVAGRDRFIVLASDGLWEFLSSKTVVQAAQDICEKKRAARGFLCTGNSFD